MTVNLRTLRLFLFGCLIGVVGMLVYGNTEAARNWFSVADVSNTGTLASAQCVPQTEEDEVFFISCGGIY